jgi:hypothetical protein
MKRHTEGGERSSLPSPSQLHELRIRILQLRWMGMEEEAQKMTGILKALAPSECSLIYPIH